MTNPFLSVSDSSGIKGGSGDSQLPSLSRIKNEFSTEKAIFITKIEHCCSKNQPEKPACVKIS